MLWTRTLDRYTRAGLHECVASTMSGPPPKATQDRTQTKDTHPIPGQKLKFLTPPPRRVGRQGLSDTPRRQILLFFTVRKLHSSQYLPYFGAGNILVFQNNSKRPRRSLNYLTIPVNDRVNLRSGSGHKIYFNLKETNFPLIIKTLLSTLNKRCYLWLQFQRYQN